MAVLIDTSLLIAYERGRLDLDRHLRNRSEEEFFVSVITASELLHGVFRANDPVIRARRSAFVEGVLERFPILPIDLTIARSHARIWAELSAVGTLIGPHDLWLAAACLAHDLSLATANVREFVRVPSLRVEDWRSSTA